AQIQFYASDVSDKIRLEINGISNVGETGSLIHQTPDSLFYYNRNTASSSLSNNLAGDDSKIIKPTLLADGSSANPAKSGYDDNNQISIASADGLSSSEDTTLQSNSTGGQVISGIVMDAHTKETIPNVAVYYDQTFKGTTTDQYGNFKINSIKDRSLVFSSIGYYSTSISDYASLEDLKIFLKPKNYEVGEVTVNSESLEKQRAK
ncbi:carboxypeptidase-like regulatory domain-containing protein, partial [Carboxylicivirga linearis]